MANRGIILTTATGIEDPATSWNIFRDPDIANRLFELNMKSPVFYTMLELAPNLDPCDQTRFFWAEDDVLKHFSKVNNGAGYIDDTAGSSTPIIVDDASLFRVNDAVINRATDEKMLVTSINDGTDTLTCTRGHQGSTTEAGTDEDVILVLHTEVVEGGDVPASISYVPGEVYNYISQFARTFEISEIQQNTDVRYNIGKVSRETLIQAFEIRRDIANQFVYGSRAVGTIGGDNYFSSKGFYDFATYNALSAVGASLTWADFYTDFEPAFTPTASSPTKTLICGALVSQSIAKVAFDKTTFSGYVDVLGNRVRRVVLPSGNAIDVVYDPIMFDSDAGDAGKGILVDQAYIGIRWLEGMELKWRQNLPTTKFKRTDVLYGAAGLMLKHPKLHGTIVLT